MDREPLMDRDRDKVRGSDRIEENRVILAAVPAEARKRLASVNVARMAIATANDVKIAIVIVIAGTTVIAAARVSTSANCVGSSASAATGFVKTSVPVCRRGSA